MKLYQCAFKRSFDLFFSIVGLSLFWWLILICWLIASIETRSNGFFVQTRIGRYGKPFRVLKIKTMYNPIADRSAITADCRSAITRSGAFFRRFKLDELPQLIHVLCGKMSFVGPRPDVPGYADKLEGEHRRVLQLRPGITGPASLKYRNEEELLAAQVNPKSFNDTVIWPDKVEINLSYLDNYSIVSDFRYILLTLLPGRFSKLL